MSHSLENNEFPLCCKARILSGFPGGDRVLRSMHDDEDRVRREVQRHMDGAWKQGNAVLVVTLTENQTTAAKVLKELGWYHSNPMTKNNHRKDMVYRVNKITLWWCQLDQYEWVDDNP